MDGPHCHSADPALAGCELTIALRAHEIEVFDTDAASVCTHARSHGSAPTDSADPASQLALLSVKADAWQDSQVRASLSDDVAHAWTPLKRRASERRCALCAMGPRARDGPQPSRR